MTDSALVDMLGKDCGIKRMKTHVLERKDHLYICKDDHLYMCKFCLA